MISERRLEGVIAFNRTTIDKHTNKGNNFTYFVIDDLFFYQIFSFSKLFDKYKTTVQKIKLNDYSEVKATQ